VGDRRRAYDDPLQREDHAESSETPGKVLLRSSRRQGQRRRSHFRGFAQQEAMQVTLERFLEDIHKQLLRFFTENLYNWFKMKAQLSTA
jgi:hypothetical protein